MKRKFDCVRCGVSHIAPIQRRRNICPDYSKERLAEGYKASALLNRAIKQGLIPHISTLSCSDCGAGAKNYDHRDYTKPLDVEPVCCSCNTKRGPAMDSKLRVFAKVEYFGKNHSGEQKLSPQNSEPPTKSEGLRLTLDHWTKLRILMQARGRVWIETVIDREHKKLGAKK